MPIVRFKKIQSSDDVLNRVQDSVKTTTDSIQSNPILQGQNLASQTFKAGKETAVNTLLGRTLIGWFVCSQQGQGVLSENAAKRTTQTIYLTANTADVTASIFVF